MKRSLLPFLFILVCLLAIGVTSGPPIVQEAMAYSETSVSGEYKHIPYRSPDEEWYSQEISVLSSVTTEVAISTTCPDIDNYMVQYGDVTLGKTATAQWAVEMGTVTGNEVTLIRNTDPSSSVTETVTVTFIDYIMF